MLEQLKSLFSFGAGKLDPSNHKLKPVMLLILDGWGVAPNSTGNVIAQAKTPNLDNYKLIYPHGELIASGESVGLPANEVGNTEVGHLTLGAGRVILQGLKRINVAIEDGSFFQNKQFKAAIQHVKTNNSKLHLMGVITTGNVHASLPHFYALLEMCKQFGLSNNVFAHAFTDGRDAPPKEGMTLLAEAQEKMNFLKVGKFATISGRYYSMDRDRRWERIEKAYQALVEGKGPTATTFQEVLEKTYAKGLTDEQVEPTVLVENNAPIATIDDNDAVIYFNFRIDRPREFTMALSLPDFESIKPLDFGYSEERESKEAQKNHSQGTFKRGKVPKNLFVVTMMNYHKNIPVNGVAFNTDIIDKPMAEIVSGHNVQQMHMAESEKERFVTYYFDGYRESRFLGEDFDVVPSPRVQTYDRKPEMSTFQLVTSLRGNFQKDIYTFFVMNIAAPDMVAHTGNIPATIKACEATDKAVGEIVDMILTLQGTIMITADHGHAEELLSYPTASFFFTTVQGNMSTDHTNNPVPFVIISQALKGQASRVEQGVLSDVAPTLLSLLGIPIPPEMTGQNLL